MITRKSILVSPNEVILSVEWANIEPSVTNASLTDVDLNINIQINTKIQVLIIWNSLNHFESVFIFNNSTNLSVSGLNKSATIIIM